MFLKDNDTKNLIYRAPESKNNLSTVYYQSRCVIMDSRFIFRNTSVVSSVIVGY